MKKATKPTKSKSSAKRAAAKAKTRKTAKTRKLAKSKKKTSVSRAGAKLTHVAKKAAVAAGLAAVGTALSELAPEQEGSQTETSNENKSKQSTSNR
jgi:hypothetical protein